MCQLDDILIGVTLDGTKIFRYDVWGRFNAIAYFEIWI